MREEPLDRYERELAAHLERSDPAAASAFASASPGARREACEIVQEKAQTVTEIWPLIAFLFAEPATDEKAWAKVMKPEVEPILAKEIEAIAGAEPFDAATLESRLRELIEAEGLGVGKALQPISRSGWRSPARRSRPASSSRSPRWAASARSSVSNAPWIGFAKRILRFAAIRAKARGPICRSGGRRASGGIHPRRSP
jgi:hypothetical protein